MLILNCASNVIGVKAPVKIISEICKKNNILILLDVTQSILYDPINVVDLSADFVAGTGHKSLLGPSGSGFLYVRSPDLVSSFIEGGSGGISSISPIHPKMLPYKYEAGTANMLAIAGLHGGLEYIEKVCLKNVAAHSIKITKYLWDALKFIPEITLFGTDDFSRKVPLLSFTIKGLLSTEAAYIYDNRYKICIRSGLQCAPLIHRKLGTAPAGTIRVSPGVFNTIDDVKKFILATEQMVFEVKHGKTCSG